VGPTRRAMLIGGAGLAVLGCTGGGRKSEVPPEEPRGKGKAKQRAADEGSALFRVDPTVERPSVRWDPSPAWFRSAPGLWCPNTKTAGSVLLTFSPRGKSREDLCDRIKSYRELPSLLEGARAYGTDVLYLTDWYEGLPGTSCDEYWRHKATYQPRADLGGKAALIEGLRAVKAAGGHVILYVEPFVLDKESELGKQKGKDWALIRTDGHPDEPYPGAWKLCPNAPGLVAHFEEIADRVVGEYGASGLFLDSYGNQRGWKCVERSHGHPPGEGQVFDDGARKLVRAMAEAARKRDPQAVVMVEGSKMPGLFTSAGGAQDWGVHELAKRWSWREAGNVAIFSVGWSLDDVHQVLALGHRLAVGGDWWSGAATGTCAQQVADARARVGEPKDDRMRRYAAEELFRELHRFRNGALLAGRAVPSLEALTPRRWDQNEVFESREAFAELLDRCAAAAERIDEALGGGADLAAPQAHLRKLLTARARFAEVLQGAEITVLPAPSPASAAYRFDGPRGTGLTCVNVGDEPVRAGLGVDGGVFEDLLAGGKERAQGALRVEVSGHSLGMWASPRA
jgi:hypothetical protein